MSNSAGSPPRDLLRSGIGPGSVLDERYRLEVLLGRGGTATVYRGTDELLGRTVAVKMFNPHLTDPVMLTRQYQEMRVVAGLHHPHLVSVFDARMVDAEDLAAGIGTAYMVLEFVDGSSLAERLDRDSMNPAEVAEVGVAIASALSVVHGEGLVHRDIKPANILLTSDGKAKLSDFGIARSLNAERVTNSADVLGTAPYLSPEQARGHEVGPATDIYALGLVLLECLTGRREYPGDAIQAAVARLLRDPVIPATLPQPWPGLLQSMTSPDPGARPTAADVVTAITSDRHPAGTVALSDRDTSTGHPTSAMSATVVDAERRTPPTAAVPVRGTRRRANALILTAVVGVLAVLGLLALTTWPTDQPNQTGPTPDIGGTASSTPASTELSAIPVGQPVAVVVTTPTIESAVPPPPAPPPTPPATSQPNEQVPDTSAVIAGNQEGNGVSADGGSGNGNAGNGNAGNGNGNGNGGNGNGNAGNGNGGNGNGNGNGGNGNGNGGNGNGNGG